MKFLITTLLFAVQITQARAHDPNPFNRDSIVAFAQTLKGIPYHYGGTSCSGFDCSGFVYYVFKHFSRSVPRTSASCSKFGEKVGLEDCQPGDIMVFTGTNTSIRKPGHLGIVVKNDNGTIDFIHASSSKKHFGVTISHFNGSNYEKRFLSVVNVLDE